MLALSVGGGGSVELLDGPCSPPTGVGDNTCDLLRVPDGELDFRSPPRGLRR